MSYETELGETRAVFPFPKWRASGLEQYTLANCGAATLIVEDLLKALVALGEHASEQEKIQKFQIAVEAFNELNDETEGELIETGEREELCELFNVIAVKAGINPASYGDGEGPASEWRDW